MQEAGVGDSDSQDKGPGNQKISSSLQAMNAPPAFERSGFSEDLRPRMFSEVPATAIFCTSRRDAVLLSALRIVFRN